MKGHFVACTLKSFATGFSNIDFQEIKNEMKKNTHFFFFF